MNLLSDDSGDRRAVAYLRVSTASQASRGVSLDVQDTACREYCARMGLELVAVERDEGLSGKDADRPGFIRAILALREGRATHFVGYSLSRMSRSLGDLHGLVTEFGKAGWRLHSVTEQINTDSAVGRLVVHMMGAFAQFEREIIFERAEAARQFCRETGRPLGSRAPYGKRLDGGTLVDDDAALANLARMVELHAVNGMNWSEIARTLNEESVPTPTGKGRWSHTVVARIVRRHL